MTIHAVFENGVFRPTQKVDCRMGARSISSQELSRKQWRTRSLPCENPIQVLRAFAKSSPVGSIPVIATRPNGTTSISHDSNVPKLSWRFAWYTVGTVKVKLAALRVIR